MKRIILTLILVSLLISAVGCSTPAQPGRAEPTNHSHASKVPIATNPADSPVKIPQVTTPPAPELKSEGNIGDAYVSISGFEMCQDSSGNPVIIIFYAYTNNSSESKMAVSEFSVSAYQNGVELEDAYLVNRSDLDFSADTTKIQPGITIQVPEAYVLASDTAPVEFEIAEDFSWNPSMVGTTFVIAEGGVTELSKAPEGTLNYELGDYLVSVVSYRLGRDYQDQPVLILELGFTNLSKDPERFVFAIDLTAFQNGIELDSAYGVDDMQTHTHIAHIKPGVGVTVYCAFVLSDESPVSFEISEMMSYDGPIEKFTIEIKE